MGFLAFFVLFVAVMWTLDRLVSGREATPLRERKDAEKVGAMIGGIGQALPFMGTQVIEVPQGPPSVSIEPDRGPHVISVDAEGAQDVQSADDTGSGTIPELA
jgi:hypothetical protein